jgi:hypothetical protein
VLAAEQCADREIAREAADDGAVARGLGVDVVGGDDARRLRHVLHDDGRLAGDVSRQVLHQQAAADVIVVADGVADDQANLLVLVEIRRRLPSALMAGESARPIAAIR